MKRWLFLLLTAWWMILGVQKSHAQYVAIPDSTFVTWLSTNGFSTCLNGSQLDTTCAAVTSVTSLTISNVDQIDGIKYFDELRSLYYVGTEQTQYIPPLPESLKLLQLEYSSPVQLSIAVQHIPSSLDSLIIGAWGFDSIPPLNDTMIFVSIAYGSNYLLVLPTYVTTLLLETDVYGVAPLPVLPDYMETFQLIGGNFQSIPSLPEGLKFLSINRDFFSIGNEYSNFPPMTQLPPLPSTLTDLYCIWGNLTSLPTLPPNLKHLDVHDQQLTYIPNFPSALKEIYCNNNFLATLPNIEYNGAALKLICANNQLTDLPSLPSQVNILNCSNNPNLVCLPSVNKITGSVNIANTSITCLPNFIEHANYWPHIDTLQLCEPLNSYGCPASWTIAGSVRRDIDGSCVNTNEPPLQNVKVLLLNNGLVEQQVFTNSMGKFTFQTSLDTFQVVVDTSFFPFAVACPVSNVHTSIITATVSFDTTAHFQVSCPDSFDLVASSMSLHSGLMIPGHQFRGDFIIGDQPQFFGLNCLSASVSGTVQIVIPSPLQFEGSPWYALPPSAQNGDTLIWQVSNFALSNPTHDYGIMLSVDTTALLGAELCVTVIVSVDSAVDINPSNNILINCFTIGSSYDPNFKEVHPENVQEPGDWETYTIHFQNTGTATADNVLIKDTLDPNLDWNSFQLLAYSHDNLTQVLQNGIVHFNFPNINLPDSTTDEPNSHGWIQYRIKTDSTITPGTTIHNTAAIYFDFNDPVITNDEVVTYCTPVETQQTFTICEGDSVQVGTNVYHQAGNYTKLFTLASGCDSSVITSVNIYDIDTSLTVGDATIFANGNAASYQWYDCNTNQLIAGATNQSYTPQQNGNYAVELFFGNNCSTMSGCYSYFIDNVSQFHQRVFNLYPNPADQTVTVSHQAGLQNATFQIVDIAGRVVITQPVSTNAFTTLQTSELANGLYRVRLFTKGQCFAEEKLAVVR